MEATEYQRAAARTLTHSEVIISHHDAALARAVIGLCGESGEVAELIKKHVFHGRPVDPRKLHGELGDVAWYLAACCTAAQDLFPSESFDLGSVLQANVDKLMARYPSGWDPSRSHAAGETPTEERK